MPPLAALAFLLRSLKKERETALKQSSRADCHQTERTPIARKMPNDHRERFILHGRGITAFLFLFIQFIFLHPALKLLEPLGYSASYWYVILQPL